MAAPEILIFDDDEAFGAMTLDAVESAGYRARLFRDGARVLTLVPELRPRLVILDIMMPGLDGLAACKGLRADPALKDLRIIVSSGKTVGRVGEQAARLGADLFVPKPYEVAGFVEAVRGLIGAPSGAPPEAAAAPVAVTILGCRSAGVTSAVAVEAGGALLLLDAGSGLKNAAPLLKGRSQARLIITHYHAGHVEGLPCLKDAGAALSICGPNDVDVSLQDLARKALYAGGPPSRPVELFSLVEGAFEPAPGIRLSALYVNHPGTTLAVAIEAFQKKIVYCPDNEIRLPRPGEMRDIENKLKSFARGADLLIHDARYSPPDYERHRDEGHSAYPAVVDFAVDAAVQRLMLFHLDASYGDAEVEALGLAARSQAAAQLTSLEVLWAREGLRVAL